MSFTGIYQFGTLTAKNGQTLSYSDIDKDGDGKISQQEFLFIQQELCLDTVELAEGNESNAENNVTDEEYVSWAQEMQMKNALDELIAQIAQDFIGCNAKFAPQVIKELRYYLEDFQEEYKKNGGDITHIANEFNERLPLKYEEIKNNILNK